MAKWYGKIGYAESVEVQPGVVKEKITDVFYYGDVKSINRKLQNSNLGSTNDDINIMNELSIVADPYANEHFFAMRYAEFAGAKWKITNVEVQPPRLILTLGGVYNGR
jgi:hypothetical protein